MSRRYRYDCVIIGGGAAGLTAAKLANGLGKRVALVEKHRLGGDCTLTGCVPSKTIIKSAYVAYALQHAARYGVKVKNKVEFKTESIFKHIKSVIREIYDRHAPEKLIDEGIDVIYGDATCLDKHTVAVDDKEISTQRIILATGSDPVIPPIDGLDTVPYLTNKTLFTIKTLPESLVVLGAGPIGLEMASAFNRLGCRVTVVEMQDHILGKEDKEIADLAEANLCYEGVTILKNRRAERLEEHDGTKHLLVKKDNNEEEMIKGSEVLIAVGQHPVTSGLGLDDIGVAYTKQGVTVDAYMRTSVDTVFACGDVVGPYQFSHVAYHQAQAAARNAFIPFFKKKITYDHVPWITYITPELARSGMTEQQAYDAYGENYTVYRTWYTEIDRAYTERELRGCAKLICDLSGYILGIHILGSHSGEILHELHTAKHHNIRLQDIFEVIHAYPAYSDIVSNVAKKAYIDNMRRSWWYRMYRFFSGKTL